MKDVTNLMKKSGTKQVNMNDIADGEIHALSNDFAYILEYVDGNLSIKDFMDKHRVFLKKYIGYLLLNDPESCIEILLRHFYFSDEFRVIYRDPWLVSSLSQKGSFAAKFKRVPNDNLDDRK